MDNQRLESAVKNNLITLQEKALIEEYSQRLIQNNVPIIYNLRHLRKKLKIKKKDQDRLFGSKRNYSYHCFKIPKKSGGERIIQAPVDDLKTIQLWIKENILDSFSVSEYAKGFKKGCSIYDNAVPHVGKELVINLDLKDFFPSIKYYDIFKIFKYIGYTVEVSHLLTKLCTNSMNVLPQGSPASPSLSNLVSLKLDKRLSSLASKINCTYTRYADDITFSGEKYIKRYLPVIRQIIFEEGFTVNESKVRLQYSFQRQEVTGLIVNTKVSLPEKTINEIENSIYFCQKYGVSNHIIRIKCDKGFYKEHLYGIAYFINMIDKEKGQKYLDDLNKIDWPI